MQYVKTKPYIEGKPRINPLHDDIIVKDERRGFEIDRMDFRKREHLQGYTQ